VTGEASQRVSLQSHGCLTPFETLSEREEREILLFFFFFSAKSHSLTLYRQGCWKPRRCSATVKRRARGTSTAHAAFSKPQATR
jgi:hypothetical protein